MGIVISFRGKRPGFAAVHPDPQKADLVAGLDVLSIHLGQLRNLTVGMQATLLRAAEEMDAPLMALRTSREQSRQVLHLISDIETEIRAAPAASGSEARPLSERLTTLLAAADVAAKRISEGLAAARVRSSPGQSEETRSCGN